MEKKISATEAVRKFSEILSLIKYKQHRFKIVRGGKPVAFLLPVIEEAPEKTLGQLAAIWKKIPRLGDEAQDFAEDLKAAQESQPRLPEMPPWD